jgi:hypothetical protein
LPAPNEGLAARDKDWRVPVEGTCAKHEDLSALHEGTPARKIPKKPL